MLNKMFFQILKISIRLVYVVDLIFFNSFNFIDLLFKKWEEIRFMDENLNLI